MAVCEHSAERVQTTLYLPAVPRPFPWLGAFRREVLAHQISALLPRYGPADKIYTLAHPGASAKLVLSATRT
ncbi:hypothetical protein Atai01_58030 [Amycolatopsis taiwanensis]|uniref:Uncharacterized protein n=1 Tax=Amycolatopsis taiwanensis TaxID=342230 RepID=A0A9W6R477_9PSEU|nr:hypothetical protein Atai01_58030 [Amycolatopsis taiwanensis]